jgi:peptidylprolyl isomerase
MIGSQMFTVNSMMKSPANSGLLTVGRSLQVALFALLLAIGLWTPTAVASPLLGSLPPGNAITDGKALLRYSLPIDNKPVRELQTSLERMSDSIRARRLSALTRNLDTAKRVLERKQAELLASIPADRQSQAEGLIAQIKTGVEEIRADVEAKDKEAIVTKRSALLSQVGELEELMVTKFPFEVPEEYANLPQLMGRATVEIKTTKGDLTIVVDGYNAPITAGNFVDLVQRKFYDGLEFTRAEDFYVVQIGDPPGEADGFIDPKTKQYRTIPMEVMVDGDKKPIYGITLEDAGLYTAAPALPFSSYGALGMARPGDDVDGGSSQFFFFLFEAELTPAGRNLMDGRYAVFGYVTENNDLLRELKQGDKIISARVVKGAENLVVPG